MKWYQKTWAIVLLLIIFFPAGAFLMWKEKKDWRSPVKILISVVFGFWFLIFATAALSDTPTETSTPNTKTESKSAEEAPKEEAKKEETPKEEVKEEETPKEEVKTEEPKKEETPKEEVKKEETTSKGIKAGTYKVGTDMQAGEYIFIASSALGYVECTTDSTGNLESIVFNDNVKGNVYLTVNDGEYLKATGGTLYPVEEAPSIVPSDGVYKDGMYKVGKDIPAGEYKIILTDTIGMGYYEVSTDSRHGIESIVTNENVQADTYLTISDGQYLKISGVEINTN